MKKLIFSLLILVGLAANVCCNVPDNSIIFRHDADQELKESFPKPCEIVVYGVKTDGRTEQLMSFKLSHGQFVKKWIPTNYISYRCEFTYQNIIVRYEFDAASLNSLKELDLKADCKKGYGSRGGISRTYTNVRIKAHWH